MDITIEASVFPTEDPGRVRRAVLNLFPDAVESAQAEGRLRMASREIDMLARRLAEQAIRDAARAVLLRSVHGSTIRFCLNKQAALAGRANFTDCSSVLGDLEVTIECDDPRSEVMKLTGALL